MAMSMKMAVFWVVAPCSPGRNVLTFQRSLLPPSDEYQSTRLHGATTQKTSIFMLLLLQPAQCLIIKTQRMKMPLLGNKRTYHLTTQ
jgi:hypothetical protein